MFIKEVIYYIIKSLVSYKEIKGMGMKTGTPSIFI